MIRLETKPQTLTPRWIHRRVEFGWKLQDSHSRRKKSRDCFRVRKLIPNFSGNARDRIERGRAGRLGEYNHPRGCDTWKPTLSSRYAFSGTIESNEGMFRVVVSNDTPFLNGKNAMSNKSRVRWNAMVLCPETGSARLADEREINRRRR